MITRRQFTRRTFAATVGAATLSLPRARAGEDAVESIQHLGEFIHECTLPGETRNNDVVPRHANAIQLSATRWLVIYSTHGYRGVDDERSIIYQVRRDAPDGTVLKEGFLARGIADWKPEGFDLTTLNSHQTIFKQHGHMVAFGVPKGTLISGKPAPNANLFVVKWRVLGRVLDRETDVLGQHLAGPGESRVGQGIEWVQARLNDREDDIELLQPATLLRQKGFETGAAFCSGKVEWMNQSFCPAVPANGDFTEWAEANHFDGERVAALKYRFNAQTHRYEWVEMGPLIGTAGKKFMEASLVHLPAGWVVAGRGNGEVGWARSEDPWASWPALTFTQDPRVNSPMTVFRCADGVVRLFTGDPAVSPTHNGRDPLYCWDVRVEDGFATTNRREIFSSVSGKLPIRAAAAPKLDFGELFPLHGQSQLITHGVSTRAFNHPYPAHPGIPLQNAEEKKACGLYYARLTYRHAPDPMWKFEVKS